MEKSRENKRGSADGKSRGLRREVAQAENDSRNIKVGGRVYKQKNKNTKI